MWNVFRTVTVLLSLVLSASAQTREEKVRADRERVEAEGRWLYNDLDEAYRQARSSGKPILVVLRCIPCEECVKLDDELVDTHPGIKPLLDQFVCLRIVGTNGLDLNVFQYDTDQSFAVFMLNADKTIYGRFGTRSHRTEWLQDVSLDGMAKALEGAITLHSRYPANKDALAGKQGKPLEFASPERYPSLTDQYSSTLDYEGDVVKSCIHCHQIGDARREYYWSRGKSIPERILFPYPHPKSIGILFDPDQCATVKEIAAHSPAENSGLRAGDEIRSINAQPLLSTADVQWILDNVAPSGGSLSLELSRDGHLLTTTLDLKAGWRRADDISWRVSSWGLARIALGGMRLSTLDDLERKRLAIGQGKMALRVRSVGKYGAHATAMRAGVKAEDILVKFDGRDDFSREADLFAHVNSTHQPGDRIEIQVLRQGERLSFSLPIQP
ncbi:Trx7/PDZ domain-containing (seleno)protein [Novipirellula artificiosorum]|uniref:Serine endoprotease n=1 Tax=Novipirellula artificiosorum TaxID=2528016 RepID=A0A5C6DG93_9BACT|nr:Trx7/PDZ domain-containing (seleno)protein [Novipirellula artificiosorum]TWU35004.1 serine endoprotease [Novipirellula artificiosorum]